MWPVTPHTCFAQDSAVLNAVDASQLLAGYSGQLPEWRLRRWVDEARFAVKYEHWRGIPDQSETDAHEKLAVLEQAYLDMFSKGDQP